MIHHTEASGSRVSGRKGILVLILAAASFFGHSKTEGLPLETDQEPIVRTFEFEYRTQIDPPSGASRLDIWIPLPQSDENQNVTVKDIQAPHPTEVRRESEFANKILYLSVQDPQPRPIEIVITARVERFEAVRKDFDRARARGTPAGDPGLAPWLAPDRLVPLDDLIRGMSRQITAGQHTDLDKVRTIYDYVVDNVTYKKEGEGWGRGDIYWACDAKTGNCTDFHALFTGLVRAAGVPAKFAIGFPLPPERGAGRVGGYHCWSEFHLDGYGWVPVDASEASKHPEKRDYYFGAHDENRVEFTEGRDIRLSPRQQGEPLNFFVYPYVEADGQELEGVHYEFSYRDVDRKSPRAARDRPLNDGI